MNNQKLNSIGLLAIFLVIAIPTVYGAVEPSIIINMESGQSEKPIQVKNSGGTIVFSVDTDGTIFPAPPVGDPISDNLQALDSNYQIISHEVVGELTQVSSLSGVANHQFLAKWKIDFNSQDSDNPSGKIAPVLLVHGQLSGYLKGASNTFVEVVLLESFDDSTWSLAPNQDFNIGIGSTAYYGVFLNAGDTAYCLDRSVGESCYLAWAWGNSAGSPNTLNIKDYKWVAQIFIPSGATITKVL